MAAWWSVLWNGLKDFTVGEVVEEVFKATFGAKDANKGEDEQLQQMKYEAMEQELEGTQKALLQEQSDDKLLEHRINQLEYENHMLRHMVPDAEEKLSDPANSPLPPPVMPVDSNPIEEHSDALPTSPAPVEELIYPELPGVNLDVMDLDPPVVDPIY